MTYQNWTEFFSCLVTKVFSLLAIVALLLHAWIGVWQVLADYVKPALIRGSLQFVFSVTLLAYFAAGFLIVWGV